MEKQQINIQLKEYNNKSRKGLYIYIKAHKKPSRLYKYYGETGEIEATKKYYEDRYIKKKPLARSQQAYKKVYINKIQGIKPKKRTSITRQADAYLKKVSKQKTIETRIKKGIAKVKISNPHKAPPSTIKKGLKKLLGQLVYDKQLVEILTTEVNLEKIKHRFEYTLILKNEKKQAMTTIHKFNQTPQKTIQEIKNTIKGGEQIDTSRPYNNVIETLTARKWVQPTNYTGKQGKITSTELTITFRKG